MKSIKDIDIEGKRVAWAHTVFKIAGVALFFLFIGFLARFALWSAPDSIGHQIANVHSLYNIAMAVVFLPFCPLFGRLVTKWVRPSESGGDRYEVRFIGRDFSEDRKSTRLNSSHYS